jgi:two-component system, CitB family, response regulator DctR
MRDLRVLVVEDDPVVGEINREFTERIEGFRVVGIARSGAEALKAVDHLQPDLILLDVYMPDGTGMEAFRELRRRGVAVDVIPVTAAKDSATIRELISQGAAGYIVKPFKFERLAATLGSYRRWRAFLDGESTLSQPEIDRLHRMLVSPYQDELPKGLDQLTLRTVTELLRQQRGFLTAEEVADQVGISRVTARRYLEYLAENGEAEVKLTYGSVGRPVRRYRLAAQETFSRERAEGL